MPSARPPKQSNPEPSTAADTPRPDRPEITRAGIQAAASRLDELAGELASLDRLDRARAVRAQLADLALQLRELSKFVHA